jgi:hypothetical protein
MHSYTLVVRHLLGTPRHAPIHNKETKSFKHTLRQKIEILQAYPKAENCNLDPSAHILEFGFVPYWLIYYFGHLAILDYVVAHFD